MTLDKASDTSRVRSRPPKARTWAAESTGGVLNSPLQPCKLKLWYVEILKSWLALESSRWIQIESPPWNKGACTGRSIRPKGGSKRVLGTPTALQIMMTTSVRMQRNHSCSDIDLLGVFCIYQKMIATCAVWEVHSAVNAKGE